MTKQKRRLLQLLFLGLFLLVTNLNLFAQKEHLWEIGFLGAYFYHLNEEDLAGPNGSYTDFNVDFRIAYYLKPSNLFGFYSSLNLGFGGIKRNFPNLEWNIDASRNQDLVIGTTFNPGHSNKFWFNIGVGLNRLFISGEGDYTASSGGGIQFVGGGLTNLAISNLGSNGSNTVAGYPKFERVEGALDIGLHQKLIGKLFLYFNYKPILTTNPIRNDFNFGFSFLF